MSIKTSKLSLITALTLALFSTNACVVEEEESADGAGSVEVLDSGDSAVRAEAHVRMGPDGKLVYRADAKGDTVPDFSNAGYRGGGVAIPRVRVVREISPRSGDNRARIQAAIDEVARRPRNERGAILLKKGTYRISGPLAIKASGIVLRGEGDGAEIGLALHRAPIGEVEAGERAPLLALRSALLAVARIAEVRPTMTSARSMLRPACTEAPSFSEPSGRLALRSS